MKRKHKIIKIVLTASMSVMIFGAPGFAAAGEPAFSEALYANPLPVSMSDGDATSYSLTVHPIYHRNIEDREISLDLQAAEELLLPGESLRKEWAPAIIIGPRSLFEPPDLYNRIGAGRPLLGIGWDRDAGSRNRWNLIFGPGFYISIYLYGNHPAEDFGLEEPVSAREQTDLFEKIQNVLQGFGFQIRHDF